MCFCMCVNMYIKIYFVSDNVYCMHKDTHSNIFTYAFVYTRMNVCAHLCYASDIISLFAAFLV